jgi:hypothetical protein
VSRPYTPYFAFVARKERSSSISRPKRLDTF